MKLKTIYIAMTILLTLCATAFASENVWQEFVDNPSEATYIKCVNEVLAVQSPPPLAVIASLDGPPPRVGVLPDKETIRRLAAMTEEGHIFGFHIVFVAYPVLRDDKWAAKRLDIALGKLLKNKPYYFLAMFENYKSKPEGDAYDLNTVIATLDLELDLNPNMGIAEIDQRIEALQSVKKDELKHLVKEGIKLLKNKRKELQKIATK